MKKVFCIASLLLVLLVAGCTTWEDPATITLEDGSIIQCTKGLEFSCRNSITCYYDRGSGDFLWKEIKSISRK